MKIVFLDFDGVLNSYEFMREWHERGEKGTVGLDPKAVVHLNRIVAESGAHVVVSSSWRYAHKLGELKDILNEVGFVGHVIDVTPLPHEINGMKLSLIINGQTRGREIDAWLRATAEDRGVDSFVILDDDSDTEPHEARHIKTTFAEGLVESHVNAAIAILAQPWERV
jgi:hypothetical protein